MSDYMELTGICKSFNGHQVLDNINLRIGRGEIIGLLGPSGAGKTTLINIMTGQLAPDTGKVAICGEEVHRQGKNLPSVGIMMDDWGLYERLSVYDNLRFYTRIYHVGKDRIKEVLQSTGLSHAAKTAVCNLSKGMRNRVNFCRAVLKEVEILLLDEPTSGLDPSTTKDIHQMILEQRRKGTTVFLTTHNMHEAQELCDRVALLSQGKIIEEGVPAEICRKYNRLNKIIIGRKNGETVTLSNSRECIPGLLPLLEAEDVSTIHSTEPDLEQVFLELTGRGLD